MADTIVIAKLDLDVQSLTKGIADSQANIIRLKTELAEIKRVSGESSVEYIKASAELKKYTFAMEAQNNALSVQASMSMTVINQQQAATTAIQQTTAAVGSQTKTFNDHKQQVLDAANSINVFNGGMGGLISRAQEAGGAGPLLKQTFEGITGGIGGMTKASLSFIATPIGAVLAALSIAISAVVGYFKNTQEGIDKVTAVTRPLQSVFQALMGVFQNVGKFLVDAFSSPKKAMSDLYEFVKQNLINRFTAFGTILEGIINLDFKKVGNGMLQAATGVENLIDKTQKASQQAGAFLDEAWRKGQKVDELQKKLDKGLADYTQKNTQLKEELEAHKKIAGDTNATFGQREASAVKALQNAKEQNKLVLERLDLEIELLKTKLSQGDVSDAEKAQLAEMLAKRKETANQQAGMEKELAGSINSIREEREAKAAQIKQKAFDATIAKQKEELANYEAHSGEKAQTLQQQVATEEELLKRRTAILNTELKAGKMSQMQYDTEVANLKQDTTRNIASISAEHANAEIALYEATNKSKIDSDTILTREIVNEETRRLNEIRQKKLEALALEKGINDETLAQKQEHNEQLTTKEIEYLTEKARLNDQYNAQIKTNEDNLEQTTRDQKIAQQKADQEIALANADDQFEQQRIMEDARHAEEVAKLLERKEQGLITEQQYNALMDQEKQKHADNEKAIDKAVMDFKLGLANATFGNLATIMGKESAAGKAMAVAQATIDTYKSATSAYSSMSGIPIVGPTLGAVAAAAAVAAGIANVKKITSTKTPKAEKGALFSIGGNRHSAGGTLFTGEDGTRFEAEKGEIIGVMNRNASRHFMAFNNTFPAGGSMSPGNYFESGGIVSRDIAPASINIQEFAAATAEAVKSMPAPVVAVEDIITQGNSYVRVRDGANF